jgi:hypothetical protein
MAYKCEHCQQDTRVIVKTVVKAFGAVKAMDLCKACFERIGGRG